MQLPEVLLDPTLGLAQGAMQEPHHPSVNPNGSTWVKVTLIIFSVLALADRYLVTCVSIDFPWDAELRMAWGRTPTPRPSSYCSAL